ncbi:MAG: Rossmann-like and DUF2520 domain-containing protein [Gammaproteobacteria bacterium]
MRKLTANFIGCGKLGKTIAKLLKDNNLVDIAGIVNSTIESTHNAVSYVGAGIACANLQALPKADIYFITTPDALIKETAIVLDTANLLPANSIVLHCSGSYSSDELVQTKNSQCSIASIHPIKSFANPDQAILTFPGTYCAIEGDKSAINTLTPIFEKLGCLMFPLKKESKKIYHAGGVIANNYLVTLHHHAMQCFLKANIDESIAKKIVSKLMQDALDNLAQLPHQAALTGPIQRGDIATIIDHKIVLGEDQVYEIMGKATIKLTTHSLDAIEKLKEALTTKKPA